MNITQTPRTDAATIPGREYNYVPIEFTEELELECKRYKTAFEAAEKFIGSHVADPDLTDEMIENYNQYLQAKAQL